MAFHVTQEMITILKYIPDVNWSFAYGLNIQGFLGKYTLMLGKGTT